MVDLLTVKRILALDLRMSSTAIESHLSLLLPGSEASDSTAIPLAEALRIVASAEELAAPAPA
jgi:hypothetical protein